MKSIKPNETENSKPFISQSFIRPTKAPNEISKIEHTALSTTFHEAPNVFDKSEARKLVTYTCSCNTCLSYCRCGNADTDPLCIQCCSGGGGGGGSSYCSSGCPSSWLGKQC